MRLIRFFTIVFIISYSHASSLYASSNFSNVHPGGIYITEISKAEYNQELLIDGQKRANDIAHEKVKKMHEIVGF